MEIYNFMTREGRMDVFNSNTCELVDFKDFGIRILDKTRGRKIHLITFKFNQDETSLKGTLEFKDCVLVSVLYNTESKKVELNFTNNTTIEFGDILQLSIDDNEFSFMTKDETRETLSAIYQFKMED